VPGHPLRWRGLIAATVVGLAACGGGQAAPSVPLNEQFVLAPGEAAVVQNASLVVTFLRVSGDSRCPGDAICIQGGDAVVHMRAIAGTSGDYQLHTGDSARASVVHAGYRISLVGLQPYPFSSLPPIQPGDYRASLIVSR
jgi:hypothetical protein